MGLDTKTPSRAGTNRPGSSTRVVGASDHGEGQTGQWGAEQAGPGAGCLYPPPPARSQQSRARLACAEAALGTGLDHHPIVWLRVNSHSITRAREHRPLATNFEPVSGDADVKHLETSHKTSDVEGSVKGTQSEAWVPSLVSLRTALSTTSARPELPALTKRTEPKSHLSMHTLPRRQPSARRPLTRSSSARTEDVCFHSLEQTHGSRQWLAVSHTQTHCLKEQHELETCTPGK